MNNTWIFWSSSLSSRWTPWIVPKTQLSYILMHPLFTRLNSEKKDLRRRDNIKNAWKEQKLNCSQMQLHKLNTTGPRKYTNRLYSSTNVWEWEQRSVTKHFKIENLSTRFLLSKFCLPLRHLQPQDLFQRLLTILKNVKLSSMIF